MGIINLVLVAALILFANHYFLGFLLREANRARN